MKSFKCCVDDVGGADGILGDQNCWWRIMRRGSRDIAAHAKHEYAMFARQHGVNSSPRLWLGAVNDTHTHTHVTFLPETPQKL
jgi:hypothetical protein